VKQTQFFRDPLSEPHLPLELITYHLQPQTGEFAITLQRIEFLEGLRGNFCVERDELGDALDNLAAEDTISRLAIGRAITSGGKVFLDTQDMELPYGNVNPTQLKLGNFYISQYKIHRIWISTI